MQVGADNQSAFVLSNNVRHVMKAQEEGDMVSCWSQRKCTLKKDEASSAHMQKAITKHQRIDELHLIVNLSPICCAKV